MRLRDARDGTRVEDVLRKAKPVQVAHFIEGLFQTYTPDVAIIELDKLIAYLGSPEGR